MKNEQYYTAQPSSKDEEFSFNRDLAGFNFKFYSNNGVFSKNTIDFGTQTLISTVDQLPIFPKKILDLGTGYGPIALFAAKHFPKAQILASDVNERALDLAKKNFIANDLTEHIDVIESSLFDQIEDNFDLVLTNPPIRAGKTIINTLVEDSYQHLNLDGNLILVVQKKQGEPSLKRKMEDVFGNCEILKRNKGYYILSSKKKSSAV
ncbi:class I SAM-dependent methyltransferase [Xylocopilactobacillus apis]|uniref:16S RNA G1207 methylase RsmC n=1 Tax=Xylocopilactobacillus apis TaxID=2932183 RepID=A0AAU9CPK7_9LACO|nr:methyltransferase [Xylocopilactobacillus apis]BDR55882.1 16S RNA G1207 methylase RsmC [Xylocopilactobacillus apis]